MLLRETKKGQNKITQDWKWAQEIHLFCIMLLYLVLGLRSPFLTAELLFSFIYRWWHLAHSCCCSLGTCHPWVGGFFKKKQLLFYSRSCLFFCSFFAQCLLYWKSSIRYSHIVFVCLSASIRHFLPLVCKETIKGLIIQLPLLPSVQEGIFAEDTHSFNISSSPS